MNFKYAAMQNYLADVAKGPDVNIKGVNRLATPKKKIMNKESFEKGFMKAAIHHGLDYATAFGMLKQANMLGAGMDVGMGAGVGAGIGGLIGLPIGAIAGGVNEMNKPEDQEKHYLRSILGGAGMGGLVGGLGGGALGGIGGGALGGLARSGLHDAMDAGSQGPSSHDPAFEAQMNQFMQSLHGKNIANGIPGK